MMADFGRHGDTYIVHAAEGETVVPVEVIEANPRMKRMIHQQMEEMGLDPQRYIVGTEYNSINPVTGRPEFFLKKLGRSIKKTVKKVGKIAKKLAPVILPIAAPFMFPLMPVAFSAGIGSLVGGMASGMKFKDALKSAAITAVTAGAGSAMRGKGFLGSMSGQTQTLGEGLRSMADPSTYRFQNPIDTFSTLPQTQLQNQQQQQFQQQVKEQQIRDEAVRSGAQISNVGDIPAATTSTGIAGQGNVVTNVPGPSMDIAVSPAETFGDYQSYGTTLTPESAAVIDPTLSSDVYMMEDPRYRNMMAQAERNTRTDASVVDGSSSQYKVIDPDSSLDRPSSLSPKQIQAQNVFNQQPPPPPPKPPSFYDKYISPNRPSVQPNYAQASRETAAFRAANPYVSPEMAGEYYKERVLANTPGALTRQAPRAALIGTGVLAADKLAGLNLVIPPDEEEETAQGALGPTAEELLAQDPALYGFDYDRFIGRNPFYTRTAQEGGEIVGPGTGTSDSIPALLSDGEFVVTAKAVRNAGGGDRRAGAQRMYDMMKRLEQGGTA
jgi:hypothetical protein